MEKEMTTQETIFGGKSNYLITTLDRVCDIPLDFLQILGITMSKADVFQRKPYRFKPTELPDEDSEYVFHKMDFVRYLMCMNEKKHKHKVRTILNAINAVIDNMLVCAIYFTAFADEYDTEDTE